MGLLKTIKLTPNIGSIKLCFSLYLVFLALHTLILRHLEAEAKVPLIQTRKYAYWLDICVGGMPVLPHDQKCDSKVQNR